LPGTADEKYDFRFNGFDIQARHLRWRVFVAPDIEVCLGELMPPRVTVVPTFSFCVPAETKAISYRLFCNSNVDRLPIRASDVQLWLLRRSDVRKFRSSLWHSTTKASGVKVSLYGSGPVMRMI
jgi:hypothetical protein